MREILFRGKRVDNGEWVEGLLWKKKYNDGNRIFISCFPDKDDNEEVYVVCPETVSQFTGLRDKHGKRIWENDIVKAPIYHDVGCYPYTETKIVKAKIPNIYRMSIDGSFEVIGNSIDNPELLTAERKE